MAAVSGSKILGSDDGGSQEQLDPQGTNQVFTVDAGMTADSVEWSNELNICALGLYQLDKEKRTKTGQVQFFRKVSTGADESLEWVRDGQIDCPAVLDSKWSGGKCPVLGVAGMGGTVRLIAMKSCDGSPGSLVEVGSFGGDSNVHPDDGGTTDICLSLDWSNRSTGCADPRLVVSHLHGSVSILKLRASTGYGGPPEAATVSLDSEPSSRSSALEVEHHFTAHTFAPGIVPEVWIAAWNCHNDSVFCTGAEDGKLKLWDIRTGTSSPIVSVEAHSGSGVTTCQWHPRNENSYATGGYDDFLRVWDRRMPKEHMDEYDCGGGVWRVKHCPDWLAAESSRCANLLAVASMRGGCHVLQGGCVAPTEAKDRSEGALATMCSPHAATENLNLSAVGAYIGHPAESLAYGIDWLSTCGQSQSRRTEETAGTDSGKVSSKCSVEVGSCSFYDRQFHVWRMDI